MQDEMESMPSDCENACNANLLFGLLYADDASLVGCDARKLETFALAVERADATYFMSLHRGKSQAVSVGTTSKLRRPDGPDFNEASS